MLFIPMQTNTLVNTKMDVDRERVSISIKTAINMKEILLIITSMELEGLTTKRKGNTLVISIFIDRTVGKWG